jgi:hypothetical protein
VVLYLDQRAIGSVGLNTKCSALGGPLTIRFPSTGIRMPGCLQSREMWRGPYLRHSRRRPSKKGSPRICCLSDRRPSLDLLLEGLP